jgi:hypothetical protein
MNRLRFVERQLGWLGLLSLLSLLFLLSLPFLLFLLILLLCKCCGSLLLQASASSATVELKTSKAPMTVATFAVYGIVVATVSWWHMISRRTLEAYCRAIVVHSRRCTFVALSTAVRNVSFPATNCVIKRSTSRGLSCAGIVWRTYVAPLSNLNPSGRAYSAESKMKF